MAVYDDGCAEHSALASILTTSQPKWIQCFSMILVLLHSTKNHLIKRTLYVWAEEEHSNLLEKRNSIEYEIDNKFSGNFAPPLPD